MCSIEEAWAGQDFDNKPVVSQADIHNAYMSLPDNVFQRGNEFNLNEPNQPKSRELTRGLNSKYSREPRVPKMVKNTNDISMSISSQMPPLNNYGGLEPLPSFMSIYDTKTKNAQPHSTMSGPQPITTGDHFTDINNAFQTSRLMNNFMTMGKTYDNNNNNEKEEFEDNLINGNTREEDTIINRKFEIKQNRNNNKKNKFSDINSKNNYNNNNHNNNNNNNNNNNDYEDNDNEDNDNEAKTNDYNNQMINRNNINIEKMLSIIITKLNEMENNLHLYQKRNMYDIILYIIVGMLLSFIIYSIMKK